MTDAEAYRGRVVVGFDGSEIAQTAAQWAAADARARGRGLVLLHAILPPVTTGGLGVGLPPSLELIERLEQQARDELEATAATFEGLDVSARIAIGAPSAALLEASETADLVVVGSRGRGGFSGLHLQAVCIMHTLAASSARSVVVGIDGSAAAGGALAFAFDEASRHGWSLIALHAWDVPSYDLLIVPNGPVPVPLADVADDEVRLAAEALAGFREDYPDVDVEERLVRGPAVQSLLAAAKDAAMIVVGTHGHGPAMGALLGSVSNGLLHKAQVPVVVVPPDWTGASAP